MNKDFRVLLIYPNTMMATLLPLHVSILFACLKQNCFQVKLFDTTCYKTEEKSFEQRKVELLQIKRFNLEEGGVTLKQSDIFEDLQKMAAEYRPHLIGITFVEDVYPLGISLLKSIEYLDIPVIAGGVFVNFFAEEMIKESCIDMLCLGEGEKALVELCRAMSEGKDYSKVNNLWVKMPDGTVVKNQMNELTDLSRSAEGLSF